MDYKANIKNADFSITNICGAANTLYTLKLPEGDRITVLDRETGYLDHRRDIESGYTSAEGVFWLASGGFDARKQDMTITETIDWIKQNANTCIGE